MTRTLIHRRALAVVLVLLAFVSAFFAPALASAQADDQEILPEWEDAGVIDVGEYESPNFGYTLEWDDSWLINPDLGEDAVTTSSKGDPFDIISLHLESSEIIVGVSGYSFDGFGYETPETAGAEYVEYWESGDVLDVFEDLEAADVIYSDSDDDYGVLVALAEYDDGEQLVWYRDLRVLDDGDTIVLTTMNSPLSEFEQGFELANESLEFNGDVPFDFIGKSDLADVIETVDSSVTDCAPSGDDSDGCVEPEETPDDVDTGSGDYLEAVADHYVELDTSYDRFFEILEQEEISDADFDEVGEIIELWSAAEDDAEKIDPSDEYEDIHEAYLTYTSLMTDAGTAFEEFLQTEADSEEYDEASEAFGEATTDASVAGDELGELLEDENVDLETADKDTDSDDDNDIDSNFI
jgi:hypothetical protein